jgi:hypothetical protein
MEICRAVRIRTGESAVIVQLAQYDPTFAPLTLNESFGGLALRIERVKFLIEAFLRRFSCIDRAPQWSRGLLGDLCILITFSHGVAPCVRDASGRRRPSRSSACR